MFLAQLTQQGHVTYCRIFVSVIVCRLHILIFFSKTTSPIEAKLTWNFYQMVSTQVFGSDQKASAKQEAQSYKKLKKDVFCFYAFNFKLILKI